MSCGCADAIRPGGTEFIFASDSQGAHTFVCCGTLPIYPELIHHTPHHLRPSDHPTPQKSIGSCTPHPRLSSPPAFHNRHRSPLSAHSGGARGHGWERDRERDHGYEYETAAHELILPGDVSCCLDFGSSEAVGTGQRTDRQEGAHDGKTRVSFLQNGRRDFLIDKRLREWLHQKVDGTLGCR